MHELSIIKGIVKTITAEAKKNKFHKISKVNLVVGDLSSIIDDSMEYYFSMLTKKTVMDSARLHISRTKAIMVCNKCNVKIPANIPFPSICVKCKSKDIHIDGGLEFFIDSIEVKDENIN
jgi:hydrogenase nickel incorporation protein HypA/HybF